MKKGKPLIQVFAPKITESIKTDDVIVFRLKQLEVDLENALKEVTTDTTTAVAIRTMSSFVQLRSTTQQLVQIQTAISELKRLICKNNG